MYDSNQYVFPKHLNSAKFMWEVQRSDISVCLRDVSVIGDVSVITFKTTLSMAEYLILERLVALHDPSPVDPESQMETSINEAPTYMRPQLDLTFRERSWELHFQEGEAQKSLTITFPYAIALLGGETPVTPQMVGDSCRMRWHLNPSQQDVVGCVTSPGKKGDSCLIVDDTAAKEYIYKAFTIGAYLPDGTPLVLGEAVAKAGSSISLDAPLPQDIPAGLPVFCFFDFIPHRYFPVSPYVVEIGKYTQRGAGVHFGTSLEYTHFNNDQKAKTVSFTLGYYI